jgi:hypothetical protein
VTHDHNLHEADYSDEYGDDAEREQWDDIEPEFTADGTLILTSDLLGHLNLDQAELLCDAEAAIRWLAGDIVASQIEEEYGIEMSAEEGQEIFKQALTSNASEFPAPASVLRSIARAFEVGEDL